MENKKGSLSTVFLIIAIILIVVMGALLYMQKTESDKQIAELENNASQMQETINNLQGKIDSVSNIGNADTSNNNTIKIEGEYHFVGNDNSEGLTYTFEENTVTFNAIYITKGTYDIVDNKIKITYSEAYEDGKPIEFPNGNYEELTIVDENTLTSQSVRNGVVYNGKYVKESKDKDTVTNNQENINKCYTDGTYYWLMLYQTNLNNIPDLKTSPAKEQRTFSLMANNGYGQEHLYGWYNIENDKITLRVEKQDNYNYINNIVNMMTTQGNNVEVKEDGGQYIITLDYTEKVIKYGPYDLKVQSN